MSAFLNRRRFLAGACGAAAIGGAQLLRKETVQNDAARVAEFRAKNAAHQELIKSRVLRSVTMSRNINGALFAGNHYLLASADDSLRPGAPTLKLWQVETGRDIMTYTGHAKGTAGIAITRDGLHAISAGRQDSTVKYWDITKPQEIRTYAIQGPYRGIAYMKAIALSPGDTRFAVGGGSFLRLYDLHTGAQIWDFKQIRDFEEIKSIAFSPDGSFLIANGIETYWIDAATGEKIRSYKKPGGAFHYAVAISPKGDFALYNDFNLNRIDLATGAEEKFAEWYNANGIRSIAFSADGALVLAGGEFTDLTLLDVKSGKTAFAFSTPGVSPFAGAVAISPNGQIAVVGETRQGTLTFYDLKGIPGVGA